MTTTRKSRNISNAEKSIVLHTKKRDSWIKTLEEHKKSIGLQLSQINKNFKHNPTVLTMVVQYLKMDSKNYIEKYQRKIDWHQGRIDVYKERLKKLTA